MRSPGTTEDAERARRQLAISVVALFALPVLIFLDVIPFAWRLYVLVAAGLAFACAAWLQGLPCSDLGVRADNMKKAFLIQLPVVILFLLLLVVAPRLGLAGRKPAPSAGFYVFYVFISSPCQEFVYRSYLYALCQRAKISPLPTLLALVLPYTFVHAIYKDLITLVFALVIGVIWAVTYVRQPNLLAVSVSHAILGAVTIILGLI